MRRAVSISAYATRLVLTAAALTALFATCARADSLAVDFSGSDTTFNCVNPGSGCTAGYDFFVSLPSTVTALGVWEPSTGVADSHEVGLWNAAGILIASAMVTNADTPVASAETGSLWLFTSITPVTLFPGQYIIGAFYSDGSADVLAGNATTDLTAPSIELGDAMTAAGSSLTEPAGTYSANDYGFFGPSFEIVSSSNVVSNVVPEPASVLLLLLGVASVAAVYRRRGTALM